MKSLFKLRKELTEGTKYSSDFKISPEGRKVHSRRINFGGYDKSSILPKDQEEINKEFQDKLEGKDVDVGKKALTKIVQKRKKDSLQTENVSLFMDPPPILVLKRNSIRLFGDGTKVALYHSATLNKLFTVALNPNVSSNYQAEEIEEKLNLIEDITEEEKLAILKLYSELNEDNKQVMLVNLFESENTFEKIKMFALENV